MKKVLAVAILLTSFSGYSYTSPEDAFEHDDLVGAVDAPLVSEDAIILTKGYESLRDAPEYIDVIMMVNKKPQNNATPWQSHRRLQQADLLQLWPLRRDMGTTML